jgi:bifunctional DNA-binding transcriptional regulator/antitoxin component of YhaV-PrlF toxin-antitoxin module
MSKNEDTGEVTTLTPATTRSTSMRATVPMSIVKQFGLRAGDKLGWKLEVREGKLVIIVKPIKNSGE